MMRYYEEYNLKERAFQQTPIFQQNKVLTFPCFLIIPLALQSTYFKLASSFNIKTLVFPVKKFQLISLMIV